MALVGRTVMQECNEVRMHSNRKDRLRDSLRRPGSSFLPEDASTVIGICVGLLIVLEQFFSQLLWTEKDREVWFSLGENHEKACRFGLHQLRNCSSGTGSGHHVLQPPHSNRPRLGETHVLIHKEPMNSTSLRHFVPQYPQPSRRSVALSSKVRRPAGVQRIVLAI